MALLAMFKIKDSKYNVEYEALHLLCVNCGKFDHFKEGCPDKTTVNEEVVVSSQQEGVLAGGR
jgi:hypothetical protein